MYKLELKLDVKSIEQVETRIKEACNQLSYTCCSDSEYNAKKLIVFSDQLFKNYRFQKQLKSIVNELRECRNVMICSLKDIGRIPS